jgi:hypothetical protein
MGCRPPQPDLEGGLLAMGWSVSHPSSSMVVSHFIGYFCFYFYFLYFFKLMMCHIIIECRKIVGFMMDRIVGAL